MRSSAGLWWCLLLVACSTGSNGKTAGSGDRDGEAALIARTVSLAEVPALLWPKTRDVAYRPARDDERQALAQLIEALWRGVDPGPPPATLVERAGQAGFALELWQLDGTAVWVVREPDDARHGMGIYLVRAGPPPPPPLVLIEAPHVYFDVGTGPIAATAFVGDGVPASVRGLFTNSVHRYQHAPGVREDRGDNPTDVAHNADHAFSAATAAVLAVGPVVVAQLHGFDAARGERDGEAEVVVSAADPHGSTAISTRVATGLAAALGVTVARFPEDTLDLGAVSNVQGQLIAGRAGAWFVHVELAAPLRKRLRDEPAAAARIGRVLAEAAADAR